MTTLRKDVETYGRHAKVEFGRDWKADAERRDFTINALSATRDGTVYDYAGGLDDLGHRRVRFIGDPAKRIAEDYLRILRFFRFHAAYGSGHPDAAGLAACIAARDGLDQLSRERVRMELLKLLVAPHAAPTLAVMAHAGLLLRVLGGVPYLAGFENMAKVEAAIGADAQRGAPAGRAWRRHRRRCRTAVAEAAACQQRARATCVDGGGLAAHFAAVRREGGEGAAVPAQAAAIHRSRAARLGALGGHTHTMRNGMRSQRLPQRWTAPVFPLKAADFMKRGVPQGPGLGAAIAAAEQAWIAAGFPRKQRVPRWKTIADAASAMGR